MWVKYRVGRLGQQANAVLNISLSMSWIEGRGMMFETKQRKAMLGCWGVATAGLCVGSVLVFCRDHTLCFLRSGAAASSTAIPPLV